MLYSKVPFAPFAKIVIEPLSLSQVFGSLETISVITGDSGEFSIIIPCACTQLPPVLRICTKYAPADNPVKLPDVDQVAPPSILNSGATVDPFIIPPVPKIMIEPSVLVQVVGLVGSISFTTGIVGAVKSTVAKIPEQPPLTFREDRIYVPADKLSK